MPVSLHSHSGQFCRHATHSLESVVRAAIDKGFISYGLSEHMPRNRLKDMYPEEVGMELSELVEQFDAFIKEAVRLKQLYSSEIELLVGMESEFINQSVTFDLLDQTLTRHQVSLDYLVGSVHHVNEIPIDFDLATFERAVLSFQGNSLLLPPIYQLCAAYFESQHTLIEQYRPEVIGHFDLCLLFNPDLDLQSEPLVWNKVKRNVKLAISYGALFEVNSAALRKGWSTPYPSPPILKLIISLGGRLTLSDDSHGCDRVGLNYEGTLEYLKSNHVQTLWYLVPTQAEQDETLRPRKKVSPVKIAGNWWDHPFWSHPSNKLHLTSTSIHLGSLKNSNEMIQDSIENQRLKWKNFPLEKFNNQTWFINLTSLPFWKNKKNSTITYSSSINEPIDSFNDVVEYHSSLTNQPSSEKKRIEGLNRPIKLEDQDGGRVEEQMVQWRWRGKGMLKLLKSDWQILGYHFSSTSTTSGQREDSPDWVVTFFHKTLFTPAGIDVYSKSPDALSDQLKLQLIQTLRNHTSRVVSDLADLMFEIHHDRSMHFN